MKSTDRVGGEVVGVNKTAAVWVEDIRVAALGGNNDIKTRSELGLGSSDTSTFGRGRRNMKFLTTRTRQKRHFI